MSADTVAWDLGPLGQRTGRITPDAIAALEYMHGPIMGTVRRFSAGQGSFAETVSIIFATVRVAEGEGAPDRSEIQAAVFECGLGTFTKTASDVCLLVLHGVRGDGVAVN